MSVDDPLEPLRSGVPDDHQIAPAVADRIEAALRVAHAAHAPTAARVPAWRRPIALAALALVVLLAAVASLVVRDTAPSAALVLRDAAGVTVALPDGSRVVDPADGFRLPDGAIITIAVGGMATIDGTTIESPSVLEVRDGSLVIQVDVTSTQPPTTERVPPTTTTVAERATTTTSEAPAAVDRDDDTAPTTTTQPTRPDEPDTTTSARPDRDRGEGGPPRGDGDGDAPADDPPDRIDASTVEIELRVRPVDRGFSVAWMVAPLEAGWQVVVERQLPDGDPTVVAGPTTEAAGEFVDDPDVRVGRDGPRVRYRVSVIDEAGEVIASGPFQSVRR